MLDPEAVLLGLMMEMVEVCGVSHSLFLEGF